MSDEPETIEPETNEPETHEPETLESGRPAFAALSRRRVLVGAAGAVGLAATGLGGWWFVQGRSDDGGAGRAAASPAASGPAGAGNWQARLPGLVDDGFGGHGELVVDPQSVYVVGGDTVWALDRRTGARLWQANGLGSNLKVGAQADGVLVLTADPAATVALDVVTGKTLWQGNSGGEAALAVVPATTDVVGTTAGGMARRALRTGRPVWTASYTVLLTDVPQLFVTQATAVSVGSGPTVATLEAATGKVAWRRWLTGKPGEAGDAPGQAVPTWSHADEAHVHVVFTPPQTDLAVPASTALVTLDALKGKELWRVALPSLSAGHIPEGLVVSDASRAIALLEPVRGKRLWLNKTALKLENRPPVVVGSGSGAVLLQLASGLLALDVLTGEVRWFQPVPDDRDPTATLDSVTIAGDRVFATVAGRAVVRQWRLTDGVEGEPLTVAAEPTSFAFDGGDAFVASDAVVSGFSAAGFTVLAGAPAPLLKPTRPTAAAAAPTAPTSADETTVPLAGGTPPANLQGQWAGVIKAGADYFSLFLTVGGAAGGHTFRANGALTCTVPFTVGATTGGEATFAVQAGTADCPKSFTLSGGTGDIRKVTYTDDQGHRGTLTYAGAA